MPAQPTAVQHVLGCRLKGISAEEMLVLEQVREAGNTGDHGVAGVLTVTSHSCARCRNACQPKNYDAACLIIKYRAASQSRCWCLGCCGKYLPAQALSHQTAADMRAHGHGFAGAKTSSQLTYSNECSGLVALASTVLTLAGPFVLLAA